MVDHQMPPPFRHKHHFLALNAYALNESLFPLIDWGLKVMNHSLIKTGDVTSAPSGLGIDLGGAHFLSGNRTLFCIA